MAADGSYAFAVKLKPGLIRYRIEFGARTGNHESVLHTVTNVVCGDAYLINGQSNAVATDWGQENHAIPICILNGAVGGTRIDQHQRSREDPLDRTTIYGRLLWRAQQAGLTHGLRGVFWHQAENDQGADGPTGGFGWETYRQYFIDLAAAWKQDYPNLQHYYVFQIWPKSCAMGFDGSDNRLREVQRTLPTAFSRMSLMSTLGVEPPGGCHYPAAGYAEIARLICPLVERDHYGTVFTHSIAQPPTTHETQLPVSDARRCPRTGDRQPRRGGHTAGPARSHPEQQRGPYAHVQPWRDRPSRVDPHEARELL